MKRYELDWIVKSDGTDHINFNCPLCKKRAKITAVALRGDTFHFMLECESCNIYGQRKIHTNLKIQHVVIEEDE